VVDNNTGHDTHKYPVVAPGFHGEGTVFRRFSPTLRHSVMLNPVCAVPRTPSALRLSQARMRSASLPVSVRV